MCWKLFQGRVISDGTHQQRWPACLGLATVDLVSTGSPDIRKGATGLEGGERSDGTPPATWRGAPGWSPQPAASGLRIELTTALYSGLARGLMALSRRTRHQPRRLHAPSSGAGRVPACSGDFVRFPRTTPCARRLPGVRALATTYWRCLSAVRRPPGQASLRHGADPGIAATLRAFHRVSGKPDFRRDQTVRDLTAFRSKGVHQRIRW